MSNQHDQDRDRIAEANAQAKKRFAADRHRIADAMQELGKWPSSPNPLVRLEIAVMAFETLCEPKGWKWARYPSGQWAATHLGQESAFVPPTRNHAADVCRLVCMVLDREASDAK